MAPIDLRPFGKRESRPVVNSFVVNAELNSFQQYPALKFSANDFAALFRGRITTI
jgi:hypothetical protein